MYFSRTCSSIFDIFLSYYPEVMRAAHALHAVLKRNAIHRLWLMPVYNLPYVPVSVSRIQFCTNRPVRQVINTACIAVAVLGWSRGCCSTSRFRLSTPSLPCKKNKNSMSELHYFYLLLWLWRASESGTVVNSNGSRANIHPVGVYSTLIFVTEGRPDEWYEKGLGAQHTRFSEL